ncbi:hypothetical protein MTO96_013675 [Rhipicephalus appendiculatus]
MPVSHVGGFSVLPPGTFLPLFGLRLGKGFEGSKGPDVSACCIVGDAAVPALRDDRTQQACDKCRSRRRTPAASPAATSTAAQGPGFSACCIVGADAVAATRENRTQQRSDELWPRLRRLWLVQQLHVPRLSWTVVAPQTPVP